MIINIAVLYVCISGNMHLLCSMHSRSGTTAHRIKYDAWMSKFIFTKKKKIRKKKLFFGVDIYVDHPYANYKSSIYRLQLYIISNYQWFRSEMIDEFSWQLNWYSLFYDAIVNVSFKSSY